MKKQIIFCHCQGASADREKLNLIKKNLDEAGLPFIEIRDFCGICENGGDEFKKHMNDQTSNLIIACYERTLTNLIQLAGFHKKAITWRYLNFREQSVEEIIKSSRVFLNIQPKTSGSVLIKGDSDWPSWFPIIDKKRCTACGQCVEFCLFGVYENSAGGPVVAKPRNCKNNCPACARICPQTAIIFPKYENGGVISGTDSESDATINNQNGQGVDQFATGDIYDILKERQKKRKAIIKTEVMEKAYLERKKAKKGKV